MFNRYQYSRWDGTQQLLGMDADDLMEALADDYLRDGNLRQTMERLMREGFQTKDGQRLMGLREMLDRLKQQRQQRLDRYNMSSVMQDIEKQLEQIKEMERAGIQRRLDQAGRQQQPNAPGQSPEGQGEEGTQAEGQEGAEGSPGQESKSGARQQPAGQQSGGQQPGGHQQSGVPGSAPDTDALRRALEQIANKKLQFLDSLPKNPAGQIQQLSDYDFMDEGAREAFQQLLAMLQQQVMQQYFQGMQQAIQNMTPDDLKRMREMLRDLNQMLREKQQGQEPDFDSFMEKYGDYFGPGINSLDDLIESMQRQMVAMQGLLDSMTPEMRRQLQDMMDQLIGDDRIRVDLMELAMNLEQLAPMDSFRTDLPFRGDEPVTLTEALKLVGEVQGMDELEQEFRAARRMADLDEINADHVKDLMGDEDYQALEQLKELMKMLEEAGYVQRRGDRYELTARGIRKIGQKALQDIFAQLDRDAFGRHAIPFRGAGGEQLDESKRYEFGDPFLLDLQQTVMNSLQRVARGVRETGGAAAAIGTPVQLDKEDFEVYRTEFSTQSSTVLMLDMSMSMIYNYCDQAAKKVAVALESLIRGQYPRDNLYIIGFSRIARQYKPEMLVELSHYDHEQGTNMAHGLMLARQLLGKHRGVNRQIILITDGGPTMHLVGGEWYFGMPPNPYAEEQTLREVQRCTREGIVVNTFMLENDPWMIRFVNEMAQINHGRTFYATPDNLGEYILIDYLSNKRKRVH
jgi:uncharacterized protein with von Willebrand factor type A (vWA) domain